MFCPAPAQLRLFKYDVKVHLTTIADQWYFGRVCVPQKLINLSLYHEILLLQKFNDTGGKVLKPKKSASNLRKKMRPFLIFNVNSLGDVGLKNWQLGLKVFVPTLKM